MEINKFYEQGFIEEFDIKIDEKLKNIQEKIYLLTKDLIIDHDPTLSVNKKLNLPFKDIPDNKKWSNTMNEINDSKELKAIIEDDSIINVFKKIFKNPIKFPICTFRARFPNQKRVFYNWHQDEGTWYVSKNNKLEKKYTGTLWFSINGSDENDSIQLVKYSHTKKLFDHRYVNGQGYFSAKIKDKIEEKLIYTVKTLPSQAVLFHPLTLHRSVSQNFEKINMRPRYSIDIRYYDRVAVLNYKTNMIFKLKKLIKKVC